MLYLAFALLVATPFLVFAVGGVDVNPRETLMGAGGPFIAFSAGVLSFLSPCVLPIVPIYLTNLAGATVERGEVRAARRKTFTHGGSLRHRAERGVHRPGSQRRPLRICAARLPAELETARACC